ncbi:MAG: lipid-A-disaccharide synthase [Planctomycetes bacterium]|nr:lipid-A-disaccharide synthase [Planctomycetota bacterium]
MTGTRFRATVETTGTMLRAAFAFVPFLPRLVRAAFTGRRDREAMAARLRAGLSTGPVPAPDAGESAARSLRVFLVAGEPSGDLHASNLALALRRRVPGVQLEGIGGPKMAAAGVAIVRDLVSDPVMGVWPVVRRTPDFFRLYRDLLVRFDTCPPDVVVGVDYPGLNLRLAAAARSRGIPFVAYVAPQVWAWAPWRTAKLARTVDLVLPILPFEQGIFEAAGARTAYVGHPLFEHLAARGTDAAFRDELRRGMAPGGAVVALLPGSRRTEVRGCLPVILDAAKRAASTRPGLRFVVPLAAERLRPLVEAAIRASGLDVRIAPPAQSDDAMAAADAAISVSGTATLHLAYHGVPAVVVYRASVLGRALSKVLLVSPWIALPNLLACEEVLPELLVGPSSGPRVAEALATLLPGGARRERAAAALATIRTRLATPGTSDRAALWIASLGGA